MVGHPEGLSVIRERQAGGRNKILCGKSGFWQVRPGKMKLFLPVWVVLVVKGDNLYLIKNFNRLGFLHVNNLTYKTSQRYIFNTFATIFIL